MPELDYKKQFEAAMAHTQETIRGLRSSADSYAAGLGREYAKKPFDDHSGSYNLKRLRETEAQIEQLTISLNVIGEYYHGYRTPEEDQ